LVEGVRALEHALAAGATPLGAAYSPELAGRNPRLTAILERLAHGGELLPLAEPLLRSITDTRTTQGVVAAFPLLPAHIPKLESAESLCLVLDAISDPGNLGALVRSAAGAGADAVLLSEGCADVYSPKVVRASAGSLFTVPCATRSWNQMASDLLYVPARVAADVTAETPYYEQGLARGCAILIGNEARGLSADARALATAFVHIPLHNGVESLNAAVAGSLLLFEARRQRSQTPKGAGDVPQRGDS
jgi:TrmH family RNA methyltransferase